MKILLRNVAAILAGLAVVLLLVIFFPELATWLPNQLVTDVFTK